LQRRRNADCQMDVVFNPAYFVEHGIGCLNDAVADVNDTGGPSARLR
jgi:hypothetical protein